MKPKERSIFYSDRIENGLLILEDQEAVHCALVLRRQVGDLLWATDGKGTRYTCGIQTLAKREVRCEILKTETYPRRAALQLAVAPTKNRDRMEWLVEKAVELGVKGVYLIRTERTERQRSNLERLEKKALSAMKQSQRYYLPEIMEWDWDELMQKAEGRRFIAHCMETGAKQGTTALMEEGPQWVLIGPEGDFTPEEVRDAMERGWQELDLGSARLRTETAALAVCVWANPS